MLMRRDPFSWFTAEFDEIANRFFEDAAGFTGRVPLDVIESDDAYTVRAALPGLRLEDLDLTYASGVLTLKGEIRPDEEDEVRYYLRERWCGKFQRSLTLPDEVDASQIQATYEAGVLTVHLPKSEELRPRRIQVRAGEQPRQLEERVLEPA